MTPNDSPSPGASGLKRLLEQRAAANRNALSERQQTEKVAAKAAQPAVVQRETAKAQREATKKTSTQFPVKTPELTATAGNKLKLLNLSIGNGPIHELDTKDISYWIGLATPPFLPAPGSLVKGPLSNKDYNTVTSKYIEAMDKISNELHITYGTNSTNVYLHILGSHYINPSVGTEVVSPTPGFPRTLWTLVPGGREVADSMPLDLTGLSNIKQITMRADVIDVKQHLFNNGVDIDKYDIIFVEYCYTRAEPMINAPSFGSSNYTGWWVYYYDDTPDVVWNYSQVSPWEEPLIDGDSNSTPVLNLMLQLDSSDTYVFVSDTFGNYYPFDKSNTQLLSQKTINTVMQDIKRPRKRLLHVYGYPTPDYANPYGITCTRNPVPSDDEDTYLSIGFAARLKFTACLISRFYYPITNSLRYDESLSYLSYYFEGTYYWYAHLDLPIDETTLQSVQIPDELWPYSSSANKGALSIACGSVYDAYVQHYIINNPNSYPNGILNASSTIEYAGIYLYKAGNEDPVAYGVAEGGKHYYEKYTVTQTVIEWIRACLKPSQLRR